MELFANNLIMILCFLVGSGLILVEAFMPGIGLPGIIGVVLEILAVISTYTMYGTIWAIIATGAVLLLVSLAVFLSYRSALKGRLNRKLVLKDTESVDVSASSGESFLNREGIALTALRPAGFVEIGGKRLNAATGGEFVEKGSAVLVTGTKGTQLLVQKK